MDTIQRTIIDIADLIKSKGFRLGDYKANLIDSQETPGLINILHSSKRDFGLLGIKKHYRHIGKLWLESDSYSTTIGKNWHMEVFGIENLELLTGLNKFLYMTYGIPISVSLQSRNIR